MDRNKYSSSYARSALFRFLIGLVGLHTWPEKSLHSTAYNTYITFQAQPYTVIDPYTGLYRYKRYKILSRFCQDFAIIPPAHLPMATFIDTVTLIYGCNTVKIELGGGGVLVFFVYFSIPV